MYVASFNECCYFSFLLFDVFSTLTMVIRLDGIASIVVHHFPVRIVGDCCKLYLIYKERRHANMIYLTRECEFSERSLSYF
jgi:hypothetical protein